MRNIKKFKDFIVEKSIGSEEIRNKWYSDMPKDLFYKIVNIDPTSVRKKDFSKPGKYSKWLIREYKKGNLTDEFLNDEGYIKKLNYYLFVFSTGWWDKKVRFSKIENIRDIIYHDNGEGEYVNIVNDILKYDVVKFKKLVDRNIEKYEIDTEKSKFDVVYTDDKIDILVPMNFAASFETAKNTQWCSQSLSGYSMWNKMSIMFRIIPKDKSFDKLKLTWLRCNKSWFLSCSKYPEIQGEGSPFDIEDDKEMWLIRKIKMDNDAGEKWKENSKNIEKTMGLVSDNAKEYIVKYYKEHGQN